MGPLLEMLKMSRNLEAEMLEEKNGKKDEAHGFDKRKKRKKKNNNI